MDLKLEKSLHNTMTSLGISRETALSKIQKASHGKDLEEAVRRALKGFEYCRLQMAAETTDQGQVWEWFSNCHIPALGKSALEASLQEDPANVKAFLQHIRDGGYA